MRTVQVQTVSRFSFANTLRIDPTAAFRQVGRFVAAILGRPAGMNRDAVPHYEGHAWCDSLEQQVNADVVGCRRARL